MSFQRRSEAVESKVPEWVWERVPFHRTCNEKSPTTKRAETVSWNHRLATVGESVMNNGYIGTHWHTVVSQMKVYEVGSKIFWSTRVTNRWNSVGRGWWKCLKSAVSKIVRRILNKKLRVWWITLSHMTLTVICRSWGHYGKKQGRVAQAGLDSITTRSNSVTYVNHYNDNTFILKSCDFAMKTPIMSPSVPLLGCYKKWGCTTPMGGGLKTLVLNRGSTCIVMMFSQATGTIPPQTENIIDRSSRNKRAHTKSPNRTALTMVTML